jgi:uroporphyrinogen III methyltransferase/synthase
MTAAELAAPLSGITVLVTRPQDSALSRVLRRAGARVVWQPAIRIDDHIPTPDLDAALRRVRDFEWIVFTSVHGVSAFWQRARVLRIDSETIRGATFAAVGPATTRALERRGARVSVLADPHSAEGLIVQMAYRLKSGSTVLYPRAAGARPILVDGLRRLGARVTEATAYETMRSPAMRQLPAILESGVNCVVFCSPSAVHAVLPYRALIARSAIACIGPTTAAAATAAGLRAQIVPPKATATALADAVIEHFHPHAPARESAR